MIFVYLFAGRLESEGFREVLYKEHFSSQFGLHLKSPAYPPTLLRCLKVILKKVFIELVLNLFQLIKMQ